MCWSERIRFRLSSSCSCAGWSWTKQVELLFCSGVRYGHVGHGFTGNALSAPLPCEKRRASSFFHSTLEPNTEVFSKVSCGVLRSAKFHLNFATQRRNDMQPSSNFSGLLYPLKQQVHSHSALGLFLPARAKRGSAETAAGPVRATRTSSRMLKSISSAVSAHPLHKTTATCHKTCVRHAKACSSYQKKHVKYSRANLKGANFSHFQVPRKPSCPQAPDFFFFSGPLSPCHPVTPVTVSSAPCTAPGLLECPASSPQAPCKPRFFFLRALRKPPQVPCKPPTKLPRNLPASSLQAPRKLPTSPGFVIFFSRTPLSRSFRSFSGARRSASKTSSPSLF